MEHAINNYDEKKFRKWFGKQNNKQTDEMVIQRMQKSLDWMRHGYKRDWNAICCKNNRGSCSHCTDNVGAYVIGWEYSPGNKKTSTAMRICQSTTLHPSAMDEEIGLILYHEM